MAEPTPKPPPKAFISYSWDSDEHKDWVRDLAVRLRTKGGVDVKLDRWELVEGDQLSEFMERAVRENNFVLIVASPKYKEKSDDRKGGVGYEGGIMTGEVRTLGNHRKFIPLLRQGDERTALPSWLADKFYVDLRDGPRFERNYHRLVDVLHGHLEHAPPVGPRTEHGPAVAPALPGPVVGIEAWHRTWSRLHRITQLIEVVLAVGLGLAVLIPWIAHQKAELPPAGTVLDKSPAEKEAKAAAEQSPPEVQPTVPDQSPTPMEVTNSAYGTAPPGMAPPPSPDAGMYNKHAGKIPPPPATVFGRRDPEAEAVVAKAMEAVDGAPLAGPYQASVSTYRIHSPGPALATQFIWTRYLTSDKQRLETRFDSVESQPADVLVTNGDKDWLSSIGSSKQTDKDLFYRARCRMHADWLASLHGLMHPEVTLTYLGESKLNGKQAVGVKVSTPRDPEVTLYFDKSTWLVTASTYTGMDLWRDDQILHVATYYRDYRKAENRHILVPYKLEISYEDQPALELELISAKLLEKLPDSTFDKPPRINP
jgi:hypothetical protein